MIQKQHHAFSTAALVITITAVLVGVGGIALWTMRPNGQSESSLTNSTDTSTQSATDEMTQKPPADTTNTTTSSSVTWENTAEGGWLALDGTPPACSSPFTIKTPADLTNASAILYPGQERRGTFSGAGGNYKPHGGFRFDGAKTTDVTVTSPIDGYVYRGSRYLMEGEIQYTFDIINPCGIMARLGHLRTLSAPFQAMADKFPEAKEMDSRTERVLPIAQVKTGDILATEVGLRAGTNVFFDLGIYDLRKKNEISGTAAYQQAHADNKELAWHAVCWFDMLPIADATKVKSLPAGDPASGKTSDYCK